MDNFDLKKYLAENRLLKENIDDAKFEQLIDDVSVDVPVVPEDDVSKVIGDMNEIQ